MSLITKIGGRETNSFVTLSEADTIIESDRFPDDSAEWEALEDAAKEYRLELGALLLSQMPFKGDRVYCGQALCFPRTIQPYIRMIPEEVKETQCFLAYSVVHRGLAARPDIDESDTGERVKSVALGGLLDVTFSSEGAKTGTVMDQVIRTVQFPAYLALKKWTAQFRGRSVRNEDDLTACVTTTTT